MQSGVFSWTVSSLLALSQLLFAQADPAASAGARPAAKVTIAVNNLQALGISEDEAAILTSVLRDRMIETGKYTVMERDEMNTILKEQGFQSSGACNEEACLVQIGQLLGIRQMVAGSIGKIGNAYSINVRIVSVETGEIVNSTTHSYTGPIEGLLTSEMTVVANKLVGIKPVIAERTLAGKDKGRKKSLRRIMIIGGISGAVIVGGVAVLSQGGKDREREPASSGKLIVNW